MVVLSGGFWKRRFGGSRAVLGRSLDLDGKTYTVAGVLPGGFRFYGRTPDFYTLIGQWNDPNLRDRSVDVNSCVIGRLQPGVGLAQAQEEMNGIAAGLAREYPVANQDAGIALVPLETDYVGAAQPYLLILLGAAGFLLLLACVNTANLLLARSTGCETELATRAALGAGRGGLLRELISESLLLSAAGGAIGLLLAWAGQRGLLALLPATLPRAASIGVDGRALLFTLLLSLLAGLLSGCAPAWRGARAELEPVLRGGSAGGGGRRLPSAFVAVEIAAAAILLIGAGLLARTPIKLARVNPGYQPDHAITFDLALPVKPDTTSAQTRARLCAFEMAVARLPGVVAESVTLGSRPMIHDSSLPFWIAGRPRPANNNEMPQALFYLAESGYAKAMGLHLLRGRFFSDQDDEHSAPVIVVDDVFARRYFPHQDPIGQHIVIMGFGVEARIVGAVGHVKEWGLTADPAHAIEAEFFYPFMQLPEKLMPLAAGGAAVIVRTSADPHQIVAPVRRLVTRLDPRETVYSVETVRELLSDSLAAQHATLRLLSIFAALAVALAVIGVYGVLSFFVGRRTREIGIRVALGGGRGDVARSVLGNALRMALCGVGPGTASALPLAHLLGSLLYGVGAADPLSYAGAAAALIAMTLLAADVPTRRALRLDPLRALRSE